MITVDQLEERVQLEEEEDLVQELDHYLVEEDRVEEEVDLPPIHQCLHIPEVVVSLVDQDPGLVLVH